jgi:exodeoxyribonuclease VII large subunit
MRIVAVHELTRYLKDLLEEDILLQDVWVRGEITNYSQSSAGHRYFALKDDSAVLSCVLFRGAAGWGLPEMRNGMAVIAHGRLSLYEQRGAYQLYVDAVEDAGIGELYLRFEELKARLEAEGLFAHERKRPLPPCPAVVGVVTSPTAAALRDILRTLRLRCPLVRVILAPTLVQGEDAAEQVAAAIAALNAHAEAEVIVVARGGGSPEELWAFNEEVVARAIAASRVPVVTGVGHETDFTIADFVADLRASTPTAAASAVVPDSSTWRAMLDESRRRLDLLAASRLAAEAERVRTLRHSLDRASPAGRIRDGRQRLDEALRALDAATRHALDLRRERLRAAALQLHALSPLLTIARGFAVVRRQPDGAIVSSVRQAAPGQELAIRVADGEFSAVAGPRRSLSPDASPGAEPGGADDSTPSPAAPPLMRRRASLGGSPRARSRALNRPRLPAHLLQPTLIPPDPDTALLTQKDDDHER